MNIYRERIAALRSQMAECGVDYYLVPTGDYHGSEYLADHFKTREYLSGFTGSAGTLLVGKDFAGLWTDGRYFLQAEAELKGSGIALFKDRQPGVPSIELFLAEHMKNSDVLGFDGRTVPFAYAEKLRAALAQQDVRFASNLDLVDALWSSRPATNFHSIWALEDNHTGKRWQDKLAWLRSEIRSDLLITALDEIAWLLNLRGSDIQYTPVFLAFAVVTADQAVLYAAPDRFPADTARELAAGGVDLRPYNQVFEDIPAAYGPQGAPALQMDKSTVSAFFAESVSHPVFETSPIQLEKAIKNATEIRGERLAHQKDGIAMTKAIYRLKRLATDGKHHDLTELDVADMILKFRAEQEDFISPSFESIVAMGEHGAIIHYAPAPETDRPLEDGLLLMDTGGQYLQGTTDITRTIVLGEASEHEKACYTAVLRGNLALGAAKFPQGTTGNALDALARTPLWAMGLDYNHGTGHGVGHVLGVHEEPNRISTSGSSVPLRPGMITSNEPGVYLEGQFGIRLENLILCVPDGAEYGGRPFLQFETLTLVPFDLDAILPEMLTEAERRTLNAYHARVRETLTPYLNADEAAWLADATRAL